MTELILFCLNCVALVLNRGGKRSVVLCSSFPGFPCLPLRPLRPLRRPHVDRIETTTRLRLLPIPLSSGRAPFGILCAMNQAPVSCIPSPKMSKAKKVLDEARSSGNPELDLMEKGISSFEEMPGLLNMTNITRLTLSHNKIVDIPPGLANLVNLEILTLFNNHIEELPVSLSSMPKLRILNLGMNRLNSLPRGFGAFPVLEVLDLSYNNLNEESFPANFFILDTLRALYLGDNDFEFIPPEIGQLKNLQILVLRDNDLIELPKEIGDLTRLRELHIQGNRLTVLPPEIGQLDLVSNKSVLKMDYNPWVAPIADQLQVGISHVIDYIRSETYRYLFSRHISVRGPPPPKYIDKTNKMSRNRKSN